MKQNKDPTLKLIQCNPDIMICQGSSKITSLYRGILISRLPDITVKSPKITLYRGKIKMYIFTAYYLIILVMSIK